MSAAVFPGPIRRAEGGESGTASDDIERYESTEADGDGDGQPLSPQQAKAAAMVAEAKARGLEPTGPNGLVKVFTRNVLETALNEEMTEHRGHEKNQAALRSLA